MAFINVYVSLWKAWSLPPEQAHVPSKAPVLYDQEREDDTYSDWEFPNQPPEDVTIQELDERFQRIIDKMRSVPGIDPESVRMAYIGFDMSYADMLNRGDVEDEYHTWLKETTEGQFQQYLIDHGGLS